MMNYLKMNIYCFTCSVVCASSRLSLAKSILNKKKIRITTGKLCKRQKLSIYICKYVIKIE